MGDRDTKEDAIRLATEQAKRHALEQVATYLESVTVVRNLDVTVEEIRSYTAGMVMVKDQHVSTELDGDTVVVRIELTADIDTEEVAQAIAAFQRNRDAREELVALQREIEGLHEDLDRANQALAEAPTPEEVRRLREERQDLLNKVQSNAMVAQAWTNLVVVVSPAVYPYPTGNLAQVQTMLSVAGQLNPSNRHVDVAQQAMAHAAPPAPPQPPAPPVPHTVPFLPKLPTHQVIPRQPTTPGTSTPNAGQQAGAQSPRHLQSIYQLNPLLPRPAAPGRSAAPPVVQPGVPHRAPSPALQTPPQQPTPTSPSNATSPSQVGSSAPPPPKSPRHLSPRLKQLLQPGQ